MEPLVSVITCCYNGERFVDRWAESLLSQTYKNIEILFVDDGSTDGSSKRAMAYKDAFEEQGYILKYFKQDNQGIAGATNVGLLNMNGCYFMVYDIDDILYYNCIERRVRYLEENRDCGLVLSNGHYAYENDIERKYPIEFYSGNITNMKEEKEWIFEDIILGKRVCATCPYLHRTSTYLATNPDRTVFPTKYQQDTQITMISAYNSKCGYINEQLYVLVSRADSHSHTIKEDRNIDELIAYIRSTKEAKFATMDMLPIHTVRKQKYKRAVEKIYLNKLKALLARIRLEELEYDILPDNIIIFGAGEIGQRVINAARKLNVKIECIFDNNPAKIGRIVDGIKINNIADFSRETLKEKYIVIAVKLQQDNVYRQLENLDLKYGIDFCYYSDFVEMCREDLTSSMELVDSLI